jgi:tight adherence protein B
MALIVILVFVSVFVVVALVAFAFGTEGSEQTKKVLATLNTALGTARVREQEEVVDLRKSESFSNVPWMNKILMQLEIAPRLKLLLYQADLNWSAGVFLLMSLACFVVPGYAVYAKTNMLWLGLLIGLATGFLPFSFVLFKRGRRMGSFEKGLPEALDLMVSALRVGHSLNAAMGLVTRECADPIGSEFRICFDEQNYGLELRTAMENLTTRVPLQDLRIAITAILIQKESGGNLAEVLDKTSQVIRERFRIKRQIATHTAQGRMTGWILSALPVGLGFILYLMSPQTMSLLWTDPTGQKMLIAASILIVLGSAVIQQIVKLDV